MRSHTHTLSYLGHGVDFPQPRLSGEYILEELDHLACLERPRHRRIPFLGEGERDDSGVSEAEVQSLFKSRLSTSFRPEEPKRAAFHLCGNVVDDGEIGLASSGGVVQDVREEDQHTQPNLVAFFQECVVVQKLGNSGASPKPSQLILYSRDNATSFPRSIVRLTLSVLEPEDGWKAFDPVRLCQGLLLGCVHHPKPGLSVQFPCGLLPFGLELLAVTAPRGHELDQPQLVTLEDLRIEVGLGECRCAAAAASS
mmetsp:Transcript_2202/g.6025  ORF Transcript_2202/g.6025 Transcript_2202/m.6025 type:complete len:254 (+) Transcript_2202:136-897(+)